MTAVVRKYNPGFASDAELMQSFCVRTAEFEYIVETLRECTEHSNPHLLVIGPRGSGKTTLLLRAVAEVRRDEELASRLFPVVFAEESYRVSTCGEFWLECLAHLADQAPADAEGPDLRRSWEHLRTERDDRILAQRCLAAVVGFAERLGKRLVLVVENINMLFADMADADAGWRLRHTLQTEPGIVLLASATSRFDQIDNPDQALYEQFAVRTLRPLGSAECARLWETVSGRPPEPGAIRPLEILTGGSPRLLAIVARFGAGRSFRELMDDLLNLVDEHTEYFKSHLESFPAQERRVYLALAELWRPATTREIAEGARIDTNKCSAFLKRLVNRGAVAVSGGTPRRKRYYLTERMYNIYFLLRHRRGKDTVVEALIQFMAAFYGPARLREIAEGLYEEMQRGAGLDRALGDLALSRLRELRDSNQRAPRDWLDEAVALQKSGRSQDAITRCERLIDRIASSGSSSAEDAATAAMALVQKGLSLGTLGRPEAAVSAFDDALDWLEWDPATAKPASAAPVLVEKARALGELGRTDEAVDTCDEALECLGAIEGDRSLAMRALVFATKTAVLAKAGRVQEMPAFPEEVADVSDEASNVMVAYSTLFHGTALSELGRDQEALARIRGALRRVATLTSAAAGEVRQKAYWLVARLELRRCCWPAASDAATEALAVGLGASDVIRLVVLTARAVARASMTDRSGATADLCSVLEALPDLDRMPGELLAHLPLLAVRLGFEPMLDLIEASPSADRMVPLSTALRQELGMETHVAKEVDEVAQDIRRSLAALGETKAPLTPSA